MKKLFALALALVLALSSVAALAENQKLVVGATPTPHALILEQVVEDLKALGYDLEIQVFTDYVLPNLATSSGELDANFFQHLPYMNEYSASVSDAEKLVGVIPVHYEPYGLYKGTKSDLAEIADGDTIALSNDPANQSRALFLLQDAGLIKLPEGATPENNYSTLDIVENKHNIKFVEMTAELLPTSLEDAAFAVINGNYAVGAGLNPSKDALVLEPAEGETAKRYTNYIVVRADKENEAFVEALRSVLQSQKVKDYIDNNPEFGGGVIPSFEIAE